MKKPGAILLFLLLSIWSWGQSRSCNIAFSCHIVDEEKGIRLENARIEIGSSTWFSNHRGIVTISNLCRGTYRILVTHSGYSTMETEVNLIQDTTITLKVLPVLRHIDSVEVVGNSQLRHSSSTHLLTAQQRLESQGKNLAEVLTDIAGVSILKTGSNIAKPVLNGLYGTRVLLVNHQIRHESQQWGLDHAPEIDPFSGDEITVIKNADAVRYGPDALAGVVSINPSSINSEKLLSGNINMVGQSNGKSLLVNTRLEGGIGKFAYRLGATKKQGGNTKSALYYLGNTGVEELNFNTLLQYQSGKNQWEMYLSHFGTELGVFAGSHIGSKEDILARIAHGRPFEEYDFSYRIESPRQKTTHDLAKISWKQTWKPGVDIEATYSLQQNHRKEYDLRRVQSDDVPMADMVLTTQALEVLWNTQQTTVGLAGSLQVNNNTPGTGTTPIIPNFDNHTIALFGLQKYFFATKVLEVGLRYDYKYFDVAGYRYDYAHPNADGSVQQYLLEGQKHFHNLSGIAGLTVPFSTNWYWKSNFGLAWRAPSANELYSDGLHHGTATYEVGDPNLKSEKGLKWINTLNFGNTWLKANADIYVQPIRDYIYAQPNPDSVRQTIRGTFPLFQYKQADAFLSGADLQVSMSWNKNWGYQVNYSTVRGVHSTDRTYLPYMPSDRVQQSLQYRFNGKAYVKVNHLFVAKQDRYEEGSDYVSPPPSYHLLGVLGSYGFTLQRHGLICQLGVENLLNTPYKDYMDRFRYYAHAPGRNISFKINYSF
ncbi:TonB-dependent receptor [Parapedobacter sp. SGR-10]|uniref:TonB-dependent receptor n=1 Tax=Parapedobacter sp. SGR-10 TaxID=2710879 RepID=UPI0013D10417|nr:TonB-dependent receptor [Parapedobacter sp. SGR-10]NGF57070.1 TonB-dependent receptor [Parapedobacter sp. SGR-10]